MVSVMQQPSPSAVFQARSRARRYAMQALYQWQVGRQDIDDIEPDYLKGLKFHYVEKMRQVLDLALEK